MREKTILIIDDEAVIRQSFSDYLEDLDFRTLTAENGRIGVDIFDREKVDLVLVDLIMPEMNGIEAMACIREKSPDTPMIVVSGTGVIADAVAALRQGAWDYLLKPVKDLSALAHAVNMALEKARLKLENRRYREHLEQMVADRTEALEAANQHLRTSERNLSSMMANTLDGVIKIDKHYRHVYANTAIYDAIGLSPEQYLGKTNEELGAPEDLTSLLRTKYENVFTTGKTEIFEICYETANRGQRVFQAVVAPEFDANNEVETIVSFLRDITHLKQTEQALRESEKRYRSVIDELQEALAEIKELRGIFPICSNCKKIRDDAGYWQQVETYIEGRTDAKFSHSICPDCAKTLYPDLYKKILENKRAKS